MRDGKARGREKGHYWLLQVTSEVAAAVADTWGRCFCSISRHAGSVVLLTPVPAAQCQVWACGFQPRNGSSFVDSGHRLLPSKTFITNSLY